MWQNLQLSAEDLQSRLSDDDGEDCDDGDDDDDDGDDGDDTDDGSHENGQQYSCILVIITIIIVIFVFGARVGSKGMPARGVCRSYGRMDRRVHRSGSRAWPTMPVLPVHMLLRLHKCCGARGRHDQRRS